ncbi:MAG TPA: magnesium and cobalt transport protein CorA [Propioniciclava tarda]|nr:magnesium and cobalt transport protein CorA [Propioniciclava tarda]HQA32037.1 magnesium and cobalt transport protein CorA [Propioniciclava tarda]HQD61609.1 magnesium and cobalt transport protein CorA [Propioniciclava tarda]
MGAWITSYPMDPVRRVPSWRGRGPARPLRTSVTRSPGPGLVWRWYVDGRPREDASYDEAIEQARGGLGYLWVGLHDPDEATMADLTRRFDLHELATEDVLEGHRRSKLEQFDDDLFMVISTVDYVEHDRVDESSEIVSTGEVMVFMGSWYVITARKKGRALIKSLRASFESDPEEVAMGPWRVLYRVLDIIIDDFNQTALEMENDVEEVESAVFAKDGQRAVRLPYQLKRELIEFKRCVLPLAQPVGQLQSRRFEPLVNAEAQNYFRELAEHLQSTREAIVSMDDILTTILQAALAQASFADNQDMRKISAAVAILAIPTTIGAVYGMNFDNMPELHTEYGYFVVLGVMLMGMLVTYLLFRRFRWI